MRVNTFGNTNWKELFPTKCSAVVFVLYMVLFINQGILVTASQSSESTYNYNTVTVVLLTEVLKLIVSVALYVKDHPVCSLVEETKNNAKVLLLYFVPAFMYCLYNNLAFVNLSAFDPTTYYLLLQFRVVVTGIVFQILFRKQLSGKQWLSLILLTGGCMIKQVDLTNFTSPTIRRNASTNSTNSAFTFSLNINIILIFVQLAGDCGLCIGMLSCIIAGTLGTNVLFRTCKLLQEVRCAYIAYVTCCSSTSHPLKILEVPKRTSTNAAQHPDMKTVV